jgi:hypothetical protein
MDIIIFSLIISVIIILALIITNVFLFRYFNQTNKKIDTLLEKGKIKDFKDIFLSQQEKNSGLEERIKEAFLKIKNLEDISQITIQKTGIIRFNPFNEMGGNQSFVLALLDSNNNGFVISSLFVREGNRVYAKSIKQGKSDYLLSKEEMEAMNKAVNSN